MIHCVCEPWFSHLKIKEFGIETLWVTFLFPNCVITHYPNRSVCVSNCKHYDFTAGSQLHILNHVAPHLKRGKLEPTAALRPGSRPAFCLQVRLVAWLKPVLCGSPIKSWSLGTEIPKSSTLSARCVPLLFMCLPHSYSCLKPQA